MWQGWTLLTNVLPLLCLWHSPHYIWQSWACLYCECNQVFSRYYGGDMGQSSTLLTPVLSSTQLSGNFDWLLAVLVSILSVQDSWPAVSCDSLLTIQFSRGSCIRHRRTLMWSVVYSGCCCVLFCTVLYCGHVFDVILFCQNDAALALAHAHFTGVPGDRLLLWRPAVYSVTIIGARRKENFIRFWVTHCICETLGLIHNIRPHDTRTCWWQRWTPPQQADLMVAAEKHGVYFTPQPEVP